MQQQQQAWSSVRKHNVVKSDLLVHLLQSILFIISPPTPWSLQSILVCYEQTNNKSHYEAVFREQR